MKKELFAYLTIERIDNGYLVKNSQVTLVFKTKKQMWKWLDKILK